GIAKITEIRTGAGLSPLNGNKTAPAGPPFILLKRKTPLPYQHLVLRGAWVLSYLFQRCD
ncbi:MAG: hypothetical protein KUG74_12460, partial [Rhodobacteraceae bacterium]|nr:hypothetical protein [Paracoccaceae bacterium]